MSYTYVSKGGNTNVSSASSIAVTYSPTAGNLLLFVVTVGANVSITLSDGGVGNTFSTIGTKFSTATQNNGFYYAANCKGGSTTFTATFGSAGPFNAIQVYEYSGIATATPLISGGVAENDSPGTGANAVSSGNVAIGSTTAFFWGATVDNSGSSWPTSGTGFTGRGDDWSTAALLTLLAEDEAASGTIPATFTAGTGTDVFVTCGAAFTLATGGGVSVALIGQAATFTSGTLAPSLSPPLVSQRSSFTAGTLLANLSPALSGIAATFSSGLLSPAVSPALTGIVLRAITGTVTAPGSATPVPIEVGLGLSLLRLGGHSH